MRRHSTSYSTRPRESLTTPCWRLQAVAIARLPPVKMRRPLNYGTVSVVSMSNAIALTMTASSATSLPIVTDKTLRESGHGTPCLPSCGTLPYWPPHAAAGWASAPAPRGMIGPACEVRGPEGRDHIPLPCFLSTSKWLSPGPFAQHLPSCLTGSCFCPWDE